MADKKKSSVEKRAGGKKSPVSIKSGGGRYAAAKSGKEHVVRSADYMRKGKTTYAEEPAASYTSRIRAIGNSKGVILNSQVIETAGIKPDADILIQAGDGVIVIFQAKETGINTDLSTWDKQFKAAIKKGAKPEKDLFEGIENDFDIKEW